MLPTLSGMLAAFQDWYAEAQPWVDFQFAQSGLFVFEKSLTSAEWAHIAVTGVTWWIKWKVGRARGHVDARLEPEYVDCVNRRYNVSTALLIVAAALVLIRWEAGLALASAVTLFYLLAPPTPVYIEEAPIVEGEESA